MHKSFGRTEIINGVDLAVARRRAPRDHRPERRRQVDAVQPRSAAAFRSARGSILLNGERRHRLRPQEINRRGLSRSFQITNIFPRLSVYENVRCALLWSLGYRYSFWHRADGLADVRGRADEIVEQIGLARRRDPLAGVLSYAEQRALEIGITIAGRRRRDPARRAHRGHEPQRDRRRGRADPQRDRGQDAGHGRARHGRGVRPGRPHLGAGLRRVLASGTPEEIRANPAVQEAYGTERCGHRMLEVRDLHAYYGKSHILHGVHLDREAGEIVSLLGRNGVGRSTTIKAIMGQVDKPARCASAAPRSAACAPTRSRAEGSATCRRTATSSRP